MNEGGLHACSCVAWQPPPGARGLRGVPEQNYVERCGKYLNLSKLAYDPGWNASAFEGLVWKHWSEKPCKGARWWLGRMSSGHHEWIDWPPPPSKEALAQYGPMA